MVTTRGVTASRGTPYNGYTATRPAVLGLAKVLFLGLCQMSIAGAAPLKEMLRIVDDEEAPKDPDDPNLWLYMGVALFLVLLGGAFAGLTIALMGQDGIYLQVIATSGEGKEQKHAQNVFKLLMRGKHWVLVTLLLGNVIVNETLPIVLDRSLGGGWPAVLGSTVLIVIFGEIIPQSVCVRYGLQIGSFMASFVLVLMYILAPVAWPTAKLLDWMLGEDHGTVYKKSGLKTLVTLHKTLGTSPSDRLNQDEVTIISAVLDLKDKPVGDIMTPMDDVFTMSADTILDEKTMDVILSAGYSRIPIHEPGNDLNFVGMLLVKILITYDPEDCKRVGDFALATLPETRPETSCLDIVNFFQEGKSHMVLVSESPGENYGALGVVTLEDVIEELIGEEIIDESDVYIDVHKAIRRMAPAPKARVHKGQIVMDAGPLPPQPAENTLVDVSEDNAHNDENGRNHERLRKHLSSPVERRSDSPAAFSTSPRTTFMMRRSSSAADGGLPAIPVRGTANDMREHLKHLGPSNLASRPKATRYQTVKIKQGMAATPSQRHSISEEPYQDIPAPHGGEGEGLLKSAGKGASDGVQAVQQGYGSMDRHSGSPKSPDTINKAVQVNVDGATERGVTAQGEQIPSYTQGGNSESGTNSPGTFKRRQVRSGSITENIIDSGGVRKVVLETNSSSDPEDFDAVEQAIWQHGTNKSSSTTNVAVDSESATNSQSGGPPEEEVKKRKRRRHRKGNGKDSSTQDGNKQ